MSDLTMMTMEQISTMVEKGAVSPVELVEACLKEGGGIDQKRVLSGEASRNSDCPEGSVLYGGHPDHRQFRGVEKLRSRI